MVFKSKSVVKIITKFSASAYNANIKVRFCFSQNNNKINFF